MNRLYLRYKPYHYDDLKMKHTLKGRKNKLNINDYENENILWK